MGFRLLVRVRLVGLTWSLIWELPVLGFVGLAQVWGGGGVNGIVPMVLSNYMRNKSHKPKRERRRRRRTTTFDLMLNRVREQKQ